MAGRHAAPAGPSFYRDLMLMMVGILVVAVLVYRALFAFAGSGGPIPDTTAGDIATTIAPTTTVLITSTSTTTTTTMPTTTTAALLTPAQITIRVLNAVGVSGLAAQVSEQLGAIGYQILTPGNYQPTLPQTRVWYAAGFEQEAFELAAEFPDALVEEASPDLAVTANIVVVLGESYEP